MPRKPLTAAQARRARYWFKMAGLEHVLTSRPDLLPRKRGRRAHAPDAHQLDGIELFLRTAEQQGMKRHTALHWLVGHVYDRLHAANATSAFIALYGKNPDAAVARLSSKLRKGGYRKKDIRELLPPELLEAGVDPARFNLKTGEAGGPLLSDGAQFTAAADYSGKAHKLTDN